MGTQNYTPAGILFAMFGGLVGAVYASFRDGDGWKRTTWEALIAVIAAAAVAEHFLPPTRVWLCCGAGVAVGLVIGYVLDSVQAVAPSTVRGLLEKLAGSIAKTDKADK